MGFLAYLLPKRLWRSASVRLDLKLVAVNSRVQVVLLGQFVAYGPTLAEAVSSSLAAHGVWGTSTLTPTTALVVYSLTLLLIGDLSV